MSIRTSWLEATFALYRGQDLGSKLERGKCWLGCRREAGTQARAFFAVPLFLARPQGSLSNHREAAQIYGPAAPEQVPDMFCLRAMVSGSR